LGVWPNDAVASVEAVIAGDTEMAEAIDGVLVAEYGDDK
jgi:hypothetical protein